MNTSTENVAEVNDVTQLQIIRYFSRHCFHAALYCSSLVVRTPAETHSPSHLLTIRDLPMSLTYTSLVGIPGANGPQTQRELPNSTQKDPGSEPDDSAYHCTVASATV